MSTQTNTLIMGTPQPKQQIFLKDTHKHIAFGGARGGGKSWSLRFKAKALALKHAGIKIGIVRTTYPELNKNHIEPLREELCVKSKVAKYNDSKKEMVFKNGSIIYFMYCNCDGDAMRFSGLEVDVLMLDEATHFQKDWIDKMRACVRGTNPNFPKRIMYTCNPDGVSLQYIKRLFIDRKFEEGENPEDYSFIQSLLTDNKHLMENDPSYLKYLESLPRPLREAWLSGRWDVLQGAYFSEYRTTPDPQKCYEAGISVEEALQEHRWTHVIKPFDIPKHWTIMRSYDFGYGKPFSVCWWAISEDDIAYQILELYGCTGTPNEGVKWSPKEQFAKIREIEDTHPWLKGKQIRGVADPSIWDGSRGISVVEEAENYHLWFEKGVNDRIAGWMQIHERLKFDEHGMAMMYFFENCKNSIRTIPLMMFDEHKPEDLDTDLEDHICDAIRYFAMSRAIPPRIVETKVTPLYDPLNQFTDNRYNKAIIRRQ